MQKLRPLSKTHLPDAQGRSTEPPLVEKLRALPSAAISAQATSKRQSRLKKLPPSSRSGILDFDIETVAAGFGDPEWVPQKITCVAWSWIGDEQVESRICGPFGIFGRPEATKCGRRFVSERKPTFGATRDFVSGYSRTAI